MTEQLPEPARRWLRHAITLLIPGGDRTYSPTLTFSAAGALTQVTTPRWTDVGGTGWHKEPFTAVLGEERTFDGYTVPTRTTAGWGYGSRRCDDGGAFIRLTVDAVRYL